MFASYHVSEAEVEQAADETEPIPDRTRGRRRVQSGRGYRRQGPGQAASVKSEQKRFWLPERCSAPRPSFCAPPSSTRAGNELKATNIITPSTDQNRRRRRTGTHSYRQTRAHGPKTKYEKSDQTQGGSSQEALHRPVEARDYAYANVSTQAPFCEWELCNA